MKQLILFSVLILLAITAQAQHTTPSDPYKIVVLDGGVSGIYSSDEQKTYVRLLIYIVNNSNDTLKYCGTDCLYKDIFNLSKNRYLYIENQECKTQSFIKTVIPPHRSQQISLLLSEYKSPDTVLNLSISMKLYKWSNGKLNNLNNKKLLTILTDNVTVKYDKHHNQYSGKKDFEAEYQKKKNMPADLNIHLLTANERKLYTLLIDPNKVTVPHDSVDYNKKKICVFDIPVQLKNYSNVPLKFWTMTCSWMTDFDIDNKSIHFNGLICDANFPTEMVVPPHGNFIRYLSVNIDPAQLKKTTKFKVRMSLTINNNSSPYNSSYLFLNLYPQETERFNQIWSNTIDVPKQSIYAKFIHYIGL
jgi:hypothetical protein